MEISMRSNPHAACVLCEGKADMVLLRSQDVIDARAFLIVVDGRPTLLRALVMAQDQGEEGVLGIADADFDRLSGLMPDVSGVIWSECNDVELDLYSSPAFERLCRLKLGDAVRAVVKATGACSLLEALLAAGDQVGRMQYLVQQKYSHTGVGRDDVLHSGVELGWYDIASMRVDESAAQYWLAERVGVTTRKIAEDLERMAVRNTGDYCVGHTVSQLFFLLVKHYGDPQDVLKQVKELRQGQEQVEDALRCVCGPDVFGVLPLMRGLKSWQISNPGFHLIATSVTSVADTRGDA